MSGAFDSALCRLGEKGAGVVPSVSRPLASPVMVGMHHSAPWRRNRDGQNSRVLGAARKHGRQTNSVFVTIRHPEMLLGIEIHLPGKLKLDRGQEQTAPRHEMDFNWSLLSYTFTMAFAMSSMSSLLPSSGPEAQIMTISRQTRSQLGHLLASR